MKQCLIIISFIVLIQTDVLAQKSDTRYMQITTVESVVGGGLGRSKMIISKDDGTQEERDLVNLFSVAGINFKNIKENENTILSVLKSHADAGWKLVNTTPLTLSTTQGNSGIFMTRYLLTKEGGGK